MRVPDERPLEKTIPLATLAVPPVSGATETEKTAQIPTGFQKPAAAVPPRAAEPAVEKAIPMPARIEKPAFEPTLVPLETPLAPKPRGAYVAAAALALLAVATVVWLTRPKPEEGKIATKDSGRNIASVSKTDAASPTVAAPAQMGLLVIDAVPWGQVDRAQDAEGKNWSGGPEVYTPLAIAVPPGQYSVLITNPGFPGKRLSLSAQVRPGERAMCVGRFEPIDAKAYFQTQGWKP
jgi:hypothetical protein